jgi:hypothetical protein
MFILQVLNQAALCRSLLAEIFGVKISISRTISHNQGFEEYTGINTVLGKLQGICRRLSIAKTPLIYLTWQTTLASRILN